jgi:hypothetical protein
MMMQEEHAMSDSYVAVKRLLQEFFARTELEKVRLEERFRAHGIARTVPFRVDPPSPVGEIPTFDGAVCRSMTPMLRARFDVAGRIIRFRDEWLGASDMRHAMQAETVIATHTSHREHWDGSAPNAFGDASLTLFAYSPTVRSSLVYLVWPVGDGEPQVWFYQGMETKTFADLSAYLQWFLEQ